MTARPVKDRILDSIRVDEEGCWIWTKFINRTGYGVIGVGSRTDGSRRRVEAHRASYEAFVGPIHADLTIDHLCRKTACCNPDHLEAVTMQENVLRGRTLAAENAAKERCPRCGSNYEFEKRGSRFCRPCRTERYRLYYQNVTKQKPRDDR